MTPNCVGSCHTQIRKNCKIKSDTKIAFEPPIFNFTLSTCLKITMLKAKN